MPHRAGMQHNVVLVTATPQQPFGTALQALKKSVLNPGFRDLAGAAEMLRQFNATLMRRFPVGERVNNVANDDPS